MSLLKKLGAVVVGTGTAAGWLATQAMKAAMERAAGKIEDGSVSSRNGYSASDYRDKANELGEKDDLWKSGFKKTKELWNDED